MSVSLITYNVCFNKAITEVPKVTQEYKPDLLCLQEVETTQEYLQKLEIDHYQLADFSNSFIKFGKVFGLVTFYNTQTLKLVETSSFDIPRSFIEVLVTFFRGFNNPRTVLKTEFLHLKSNKKITVYNVHFTPLFASNKTRIKQLLETFNDLNISQNEPTIIAGDFNYPYGRKKFEELLLTYGLQEATNNLTFTSHGLQRLLFLKLKFDYILYRNLQHVETKRSSIKTSDHYPIYATFNV